MHKLIGIYRITNIVNNKIYIGQTINYEKRKREHINRLLANSHTNRHLQSAWNKYGQQNFIFDFIENCSENMLTEREQYWIDYYGGIDNANVYNNREAGDSGEFSEETRALISSKIKGRHLSEETKHKISETSKGRHHTEETKRKISETSKGRTHMRGRHLSEETKKKISDKLKGRPAHNKGIIQSEETKQKISNSLKGRTKRPRTEDEKRAQSERMKGKIPWNKGKLQGNAHKVGQYSLDGELIKIYLSTSQAISDGYGSGCISKCCRGKMKQAYGYIWKYLD